MSLDDKLPQLLKEHAESYRPGSDGMAGIQRHLARRRRGRVAYRLAIPVLALAAMLGVGVPLLIRSNGGQQLHVTNPPVTAAITSTPSSAKGVPLRTVDWAAAVAPRLNCGSYPDGTTVPVAVGQVAYVDPAPGIELAVVLAHCSPGAGSPPIGLFSFDQAYSRTSAHLAQVLLDTGLDRQASGFTVDGSTITMMVSAYSNWAVASCCPDLHYKVTWAWNGVAYLPNPFGAAGDDPLLVQVSAAPAAVTVGQKVAFTVTLRVEGSAPTTWIGVTDVLPQQMTLIDKDPKCRPLTTPFPIDCGLNPVAAGSSVDLFFVAKVAGYTPELQNTFVAFGVNSYGRVSATTNVALTWTSGTGPQVKPTAP